MPDDLRVNGWLVIPAAELHERFSRSSGPGGQSVNTADSRVELSFDVEHSAVLPEWARARALERLAGRLSGGVLTIAASEQRSQLANRQAARARLADLLRDAIAPPPRPRVPTRPGRAANERRLQAKHNRAAVKRTRRYDDRNPDLGRCGTLPGMDAGLRVHQGGSGEPVLLLLHGLGATGDVWQGWRSLLGRRWPGRWLAPDLPGHGGSPPLPGYTFESLAAAVAGTVGGDTRAVVLGHSLGGVVGLALAGGGFEVRVQAVIGLGIKVAWTEEELDRARALAHRSPAWFASRDEAAARYLRISGLAGLLDAAGPAVDAGLQEQDGRWRLAMDPAAFGVGAPDMPQLLARSRAPVTLARGEHDSMNTDEQLRRLGMPVVTLPGLGHNAHVEGPHPASVLLDPHRHAVLD